MVGLSGYEYNAIYRRCNRSDAMAYLLHEHFRFCGDDSDFE